MTRLATDVRVRTVEYETRAEVVKGLGIAKHGCENANPDQDHRLPFIHCRDLTSLKELSL